MVGGGLFVPLHVEDLFDDAETACSLVSDPLAERETPIPAARAAADGEAVRS